jgi:mannose/fructose-specific phosphotransferase system component IIA
VGLVVVTHGGAAVAMVTAVEKLVGEVTGITGFGVRRDETKDAIASALTNEIAKVDRGAGVLVLCDLHGATPANVAVELRRQGQKVAVLCGVNLPMLLKASTANRAVAPDELAHVAAETAIRSIKIMGTGEGGPA